jgi:hypothetical protein
MDLFTISGKISTKMATETSKQLVAELENALYEMTHGYTQNQQGMPDFYRGVAAKFRRIIKQIEGYDRWALEDAEVWEKDIAPK